VFVVASARADFDPAKILFEFDGVRWDSAPSREKGQNIAPCVTNGPPFSRTGNERVEAEAMVVAARMVAFGEYSVDGTASAMKARDYKDATDLVAQSVAHSLTASRSSTQCPNEDTTLVPLSYTTKMHNTTSNQAGKFYEEYSTSLDANSPPPAVFQPIPINSMNALRSADADKTTGCGIGEAGEAMFTITKGHSHAVAQPIGLDEEQNAMIDAFGTLKARTAGGGFEGTVMQTNMAVRRLTPVECERLQGFPDNYTNIPWRKKDESPDGPRYKALGNSWAVPNVRWIGKRIQEHLS
jgi:DNA (cytosine-5)-methyltransferase 1